MLCLYQLGVQEMSATRFSRQECLNKWGHRGEHPTHTRAAHQHALTAPDRQRTELSLEPDYWAWVAEKVAGTFRDASRGN